MQYIISHHIKLSHCLWKSSPYVNVHTVCYSHLLTGGWWWLSETAVCQAQEHSQPGWSRPAEAAPSEDIEQRAQVEPEETGFSTTCTQ